MDDAIITIPHGDIEVNIDDENKLEAFLMVLKAFNYQSLDDLWNIFGGEETVDELESECDELVADGLMWRYTVNGDKYYVLNPDRRADIKNIIEEDD